ncbi:MAG: NADP-dependent phosphogluconate dehydrogenase [Gemmataceae bacterium]|nr:NADP-dependent phosphogluconate dehydrogenase [Gemmataceae bacterium]
MALNLFDLGLVGLGVMGRNLLLNMADHGFAVLGYDKDLAKGKALEQEGAGKNVAAASDLAALVSRLKSPRAVLLLVPAGKVVDAVLGELVPHLSRGDLVIDSGNSHFKDTERRLKELAEKDILFLGMGISGGEAGARHGPSLMPGGPRAGYERVRPILEAVAAKVESGARSAEREVGALRAPPSALHSPPSALHSSPSALHSSCVAYLGPGACGHYVKMVHNGIEYGLMQLLAEVYDLLHRGLGFDCPKMAKVFEQWGQGELDSFLVEITAKIFRKTDPKTGSFLVDVISDVARQKGTGKWTSQEAFDLQVPFLTGDAAVSMRDLSGQEEARRAGSRALLGAHKTFSYEPEAFLPHLEAAYHAASVMTYAQGFALMQAASKKHGYDLDLATVARIWRGGCIIRAAVLEDICRAFEAQPALVNLMLDPKLAQEITKRQRDLRFVLRTAIDLGIPVPALASTLAYFDAYRAARLPTNLIQAQRDFFGAHMYERIDEPGTYHTEWDEMQPGLPSLPN